MVKHLLFIKHYPKVFSFLFPMLLGLLIKGNEAYAQGAAPEKTDVIKFSAIKDYLSEGTVTSIVQDYKGVLWFGTRNGLNRYNGIGFSVYEHVYNDSTSLSNSYVTCLLEDSKQNLWVGTVDGLNLYNRNHDTFKRFQYSSEDNLSLSHNKVYAIFEDSQRIIWIGTEGGLNRYDPKTGSFIRFTHDSNDKNSLAHNDIRTVFEDKEGNIWVGTYGGGLDRYDPEHKRFIHYQYNPAKKESISSNYIRTSFKDQDGDIWIGSKGGLNLLQKNDGGFEFKRYLHDIHNPNSLPNNIVSAIAQDNNGNLWFGTENGGLAIFDKQTQSFSIYDHDPLDPNSISHNSIWSLYRDNVGTMWVGFFNKGINKWDKHQSKFNHFNINSSKNSLSNGNVTCFYENDAHHIWIGTDGGGLNLFNRKTKKFKHYVNDPLNEKSIGSDAVTGIIEDNQNNLWVGTWEGGLNLFNRETNHFKRYLHDPADSTSINSNNVFAILEDSKGRLWVGAFEAGLDLFDRETQTFTHFTHDPEDPHSLTHDKVFVLFEDSKHQIWIGTEGGGLSLMKEDEKGEISFVNYHHYSDDSTSLGGNVVIEIFEDSQQQLWVGTFGGGLSRFIPEKNSFKTYRKEHGLPNNVIQGILEDTEGNLWISTNEGISKFNIEKETFRNYSVADGLQANEFIRGAAYKTADGEMFFGGVNGFNTFNPCDVIDNPNVPPVYITDFSIYGKSVKPGQKGSPLRRHISDTEKIVLNHDQNVFSFELSALNYSQASENQYAYKLEGYDKHWQYIGHRRNVYYTKVPQGSYVFKVKGSNNDGIWNEVPTEVEVIVRPPWYATWWAYTFYVFLGLTLFYFYRQNLINRERLKSHLKLEQMELSKMQEVDQMKSNFFANISHEFRTPLTLILGPLKSMHAGRFEGDLKSQLSMMIRSGDRLLRLINQLLDLSKLGGGNMKLKALNQDVIDFLKPIVASFLPLAENRQIRLSLKAPEGPIHLFFDPDKLEKIIFNLLTNALKFTKEKGEVVVKVTLVKQKEVQALEDGTHNGNIEEYLLLEVNDNGIGIRAEDIGHVFDRFYQGDTDHHSAIKGTGIGLSLTKELVELHHGFIQVESELNEGSTFKVYLPLGNGHMTEEEIRLTATANSLSDKTFKDLQYLSSEEEKHTEIVIGPEKDRKNRPTILIVEDNVDLSQYIADQLKRKYNIVSANNGNEGFEKAIACVPELIISDVMMPGLNGYELCKMIKAHEQTNHIPIILLTAKVTPENQKEGFETGADYYMTKPFDGALLRVRVRNILNSREKWQDHFKNNQLALAPKKINLTSSEETFLKDVLQCIEKNMANSAFCVEELGSSLGMSRMQLYRKLKAYTGQSANEFIRSIRLRRAAQLLETGELTIAEVTYEVGFNDLKHFRACFKKEFGVNPSQYGRKTFSNKI